MTRPFEALRQKLGIPDDCQPEPPAPVDGPVYARCSCEDCPGKLRFMERDGPLWVVRCDSCEYEGGVPVRLVDPQIRRRNRLEAADLPVRFKGLRFEQTAENLPALRAVKDWLAGADENPVERVSSLLPAPLLWGLNGRGKSHLLAAVCSRLVMEHDLTVLFRSARGLLRELQRFEDPVARERAWSRAVRVDVLALDDLGSERSTGWTNDQLGDLIDERYSKERPVIAATNYPPQAWEEEFDARTFSRLRAMTFPVELGGPDRRLASQTELKGS